MRPFVALSASYRALAPHLNAAYQWNGKSLLAGDVRDDFKADMPDQFHYAIGTDLAVNQHLSLLVDLLGQRLVHSPRLSTFDFVAGGPRRQRQPARPAVPDRIVLDEQRISSASRPTSRRSCWSTSTCASPSATAKG